VSDAWGDVNISEEKIEINVMDGILELKEYLLPKETSVQAVYADGNEIGFTLDENKVIFENSIRAEKFVFNIK